MKVCLANQDGKWVELNVETTSNCSELVVAERDSRWIWPDKDFYDRRQGSRLFRLISTYNIGTIFEETPAALKALTESGALERLDQAIDRGEKTPEQVTCEKAFGKAKTFKEWSAVDAKCKGHTGSRAAYMRILEENDLAKRIQQQTKADQFRPKCSKIEFSGVAVGDAANLDALNAAPNQDRVIARYPLNCTPSGITQLYACRGAALFSRHTGYIIAWTQRAYQIATPVDLTRGRKDAMLYINRKDTVCRDKVKPSTDFNENWKNFMLNHNAYR